jgi:hypothetical protein
VDSVEKASRTTDQPLATQLPELRWFMACEIIHYRGYELHLDPQGSGLKAAIWHHGLYFMQPAIPFSPDKSLREQLIAQGKSLVDAMFDRLGRGDH